MAQLETQATRQTSQRNEAKKSTASKAAARASLLTSLHALQRTARVLALTQPGLEQSFQLPGRMTDTRLLTILLGATALRVGVHFPYII